MSIWHIDITKNVEFRRYGRTYCEKRKRILMASPAIFLSDTLHLLLYVDDFAQKAAQIQSPHNL